MSSDIDIIQRLALASAHGVRQKALVEELLKGPAYMVPNHWGMGIGKARCDPMSWRSLKKRLQQNGFVINQETYAEAQKQGRNRKIEMKFQVNFYSP
jgi:hypothetical protein